MQKVQTIFSNTFEKEHLSYALSELSMAEFYRQGDKATVESQLIEANNVIESISFKNANSFKNLAFYYVEIGKIDLAEKLDLSIKFQLK